MPGRCPRGTIRRNSACSYTGVSTRCRRSAANGSGWIGEVRTIRRDYLHENIRYIIIIIIYVCNPHGQSYDVRGIVSFLINLSIFSLKRSPSNKNQIFANFFFLVNLVRHFLLIISTFIKLTLLIYFTSSEIKPMIKCYWFALQPLPILLHCHWKSWANHWYWLLLGGCNVLLIAYPHTDIIVHIKPSPIRYL